MVTKNDFMRIMAQQDEIALATSVHENPNVRIVNFYFDKETNKLYFATFQDNDKVKELKQNSRIAITTIPHGVTEHVKIIGEASVSSLTIFDVAEKFITKVPDYKEIIENAGAMLVLFEVLVTEALVTLDFQNSGMVTVS